MRLSCTVSDRLAVVKSKDDVRPGYTYLVDSTILYRGDGHTIVVHDGTADTMQGSLCRVFGSEAAGVSSSAPCAVRIVAEMLGKTKAKWLTLQCAQNGKEYITVLLGGLRAQVEELSMSPRMCDPRLAVRVSPNTSVPGTGTRVTYTEAKIPPKTVVGLFGNHMQCKAVACKHADKHVKLPTDLDVYSWTTKHIDIIDNPHTALRLNAL